MGGTYHETVTPPPADAAAPRSPSSHIRVNPSPSTAPIRFHGWSLVSGIDLHGPAVMGSGRRKQSGFRRRNDGQRSALAQYPRRHCRFVINRSGQYFDADMGHGHVRQRNAIHHRRSFNGYNIQCVAESACRDVGRGDRPHRGGRRNGSIRRERSPHRRPGRSPFPISRKPAIRFRRPAIAFTSSAISSRARFRRRMVSRSRQRQALSIGIPPAIAPPNIPSKPRPAITGSISAACPTST